MPDPSQLHLEAFTDLDLSVFARRLAAAREVTGLSQQAVAWRADIAQSTLARLESPAKAEGPGPSLQTLYRLCQVLRCSADALMGL